MIDFDDTQTEVVTIELRYDQTFGLWDDAGKIWTRIQSRFPDLNLNTAMPQQQIFESSQYKMTIELGAFRVIARAPNPEVSAAVAAQEMLDACSKYLNLSVFSRLGFRQIRTRKAPNLRDATADAGEMLPRQFGSAPGNAKVTAFHASLKHETETLGIIAAMRGEERQVKANIPWELSEHLTPNKAMERECVIVFDTDYFTIGATERESLNLPEWARQAERYIKKYWKAVLQ